MYVAKENASRQLQLATPGTTLWHGWHQCKGSLDSSKHIFTDAHTQIHTCMYTHTLMRQIHRHHYLSLRLSRKGRCERKEVGDGNTEARTTGGESGGGC